MNKDSISEDFFELCVFTHKACRLTLKDKILFLLTAKPLTPPYLVEQLLIEKSNLTAIMSKLRSEELVEQRHLSRDRRQIEYRLTIKGADYINLKLAQVEKEFNNFLTSRDEYSAAKEKIVSVNHILSFMK